MKPSLPHVIQFGDELVRILDAWPATIDHDDIAELALKRASARVLQCTRRVPINLQEVETRPWHREHIGRLRLLVPSCYRPSGSEIVEELRPGCFGLAN